MLVQLKALTVAVALVVAANAYQLTPKENTVVEVGAQKYAQLASGTVVSCANLDDDNDGRVACSIKEQDGEILPVFCTYKDIDGCKSGMKSEVQQLQD